MFACTGCFHGGIQGQNIGLEGNGVDHLNDLIDPFGALFQAVHQLAGLLRFMLARFGFLGGILRQQLRLAGGVGILAHDGRDLVHAGGGLLECRRLLLSA